MAKYSESNENKDVTSALDDAQETLPQAITIEKLVYGGDGLGRLSDGKVVFVPWSVPGDRLLVKRITNDQKPQKWQPIEVFKSAAHRVEARCSVFGLCGGCQWQQVSPTAQREWKQRIVEESLIRLGKLTGIKVSETLGYENENAQWHFRNRVQWEVQWNEKLQRYELGYCKAGSHDVVAFETCWIIPVELSQLANWLQDYFFQNTQPASSVKRIEVMQNAEGQILLSFYQAGGEEAVFDPLIQALTQRFPAIACVVVFASAKPQLQFGQSFIHETVLGKKYRVSAGSFFQTNRSTTEMILKILAQWLPPQVDSLLDLYAGVGLFSLHFQDRAKRIVAIEGASFSVADARENAREQGISHIEWLSGDAKKSLHSLKENFEIAIVDPPRAGCQRDVLAWLSRRVTWQLIYVSCNPTTLARDLKILTEGGWTIKTVQPVDMFPQTYHVETVVQLLRTR